MLTGRFTVVPRMTVGTYSAAFISVLGGMARFIVADKSGRCLLAADREHIISKCWSSEHSFEGKKTTFCLLQLDFSRSSLLGINVESKISRTTPCISAIDLW